MALQASILSHLAGGMALTTRSAGTRRVRVPLLPFSGRRG